VRYFYSFSGTDSPTMMKATIANGQVVLTESLKTNDTSTERNAIGT
jgi:hypothetical protein